MPKNVRNFWLELTVDGTKSKVEAGPRSKDGGFNLTIKMRRDGAVINAAQIGGRAKDDGTLELWLQDTTPPYEGRIIQIMSSR